jgi:hypothetical protein
MATFKISFYSLLFFHDETVSPHLNSYLFKKWKTKKVDCNHLCLIKSYLKLRINIFMNCHYQEVTISRTSRDVWTRDIFFT